MSSCSRSVFLSQEALQLEVTSALHTVEDLYQDFIWKSIHSIVSAQVVEIMRAVTAALLDDTLDRSGGRLSKRVELTHILQAKNP